MVMRLIILVLILGCNLKPNNEIPKPEPPYNGRFPENINHQKEGFKSSLDQKLIPTEWDESSTDPLAGDQILQKTGTKVSGRRILPFEIYKNSQWLYYENFLTPSGKRKSPPLTFFAFLYDKDVQYDDRKGINTLGWEINTKNLDSLNFFPEEKLKGFHSETIYLQIIPINDSNEAYSIPILKGSEIPSDNSVVSRGEVKHSDVWDPLIFTAFIAQCKALLKENRPPAMVRLAWQGTNSEGKPETIYSGEYKFEDKEMVNANSSLLKILLNGKWSI